MFSAATKTGSQPATGAANYIEDVFSTYLYTGNNSTQTIVNGIQLGDTTTGGSQNFFPANSYSQLSTSSAMNFGTSNWTIEFFYQGSPNSFGVAFEIFTSGVNTQLISIQRNGTGADAIYVQNASVVLTTSGATPWDGAWHHHAIVRNGGTVTYYIDGVSRGTYSTSLNLTGSNTVRIGNYSAIPGYGINGYLSNLRVVSGTAVYTSTFTPPTSALTAISGTQLLTCQSPSPFTDNSTNAFAISAYNAAGSGIQGPFSPTVAGKGGMVWLKPRSVNNYHTLWDTARGVRNYIMSQATDANATASAGYGLTAFNSNGFSLGSNWAGENQSGTTEVSWTFRKQPKFFDVVTWSSPTSSDRTIPHNLGSVPGLIFVKRTDAAGSWFVWSNTFSSPNNDYLLLNTTDAKATFSNTWGTAGQTSTAISVGAGIQAASATYVAYLFAHNAGGFGESGTDNVISCGSLIAGTQTTVNLGYEPQYVLIKNTTTGGNNWYTVDVMRGMSNTNIALLQPNLSASESPVGLGGIVPTATGFIFDNSLFGYTSGDNVIYMAIRRPMKVPTDATTVFNTNLETTTTTPQTLTTGFPVDLSINTIKNISVGRIFMDRLRGGSQTYYNYLDSTATSAEATGSGASGVGFDNNTGIVDNNWWNNTGSVWWSFSRRPGFFDEVCYTATGSSPLALNHNLGTAPQMMIVKGRSGASDWPVYHIGENGGVSPEQYYLRLNGTSANSNAVANWSNTAPTATQFTVGGNNNASGYTYVAYLFATCPGVSKVGSYTGTGATQTINCGFGAGGARFVIIKRTDSTGAWYVWDTARGMVSGTDPSLQLNSTAAESNANSVYTATTGFSLLASPSADVNTSGGSYIYLAIA